MRPSNFLIHDWTTTRCLLAIKPRTGPIDIEQTSVKNDPRKQRCLIRYCVSISGWVRMLRAEEGSELFKVGQ